MSITRRLYIWRDSMCIQQNTDNSSTLVQNQHVVLFRVTCMFPVKRTDTVLHVSRVEKGRASGESYTASTPLDCELLACQTINTILSLPYTLLQQHAFTQGNKGNSLTKSRRAEQKPLLVRLSYLVNLQIFAS
jgi:hypothetical protein